MNVVSNELVSIVCTPEFTFNYELQRSSLAT